MIWEIATVSRATKEEWRLGTVLSSPMNQRTVPNIGLLEEGVLLGVDE